MSAEKKYTEREMVLAQRAAWIACDREFVAPAQFDDQYSEAEAAKRYPLPKVTRPRVVTDPHTPVVLWRVQFGDIQHSYKGSPFRLAGGSESETHMLAPTKSRVALWADLLANPTEECEAES